TALGVSAVKVILCADCGNLMQNYSHACDRCNNNHLEFFRDIDSPRFRRRLKQVTGTKEPLNPILRALYVVAIAALLTAASYNWIHSASASDEQHQKMSAVVQSAF
ncbi:MAG TPA: hypothetical protein V6C72_02385, partial [Chroococcales cyanobacterium]